MKVYKCDCCEKIMSSPEIIYPCPIGREFCSECFLGGSIRFKIEQKQRTEQDNKI